MTRRPLIAGNWKLHKTVAEAKALAGELSRKLGRFRDRDIVIAPPYTALWPVAQALQDSTIQLAGQDLFYEDKGAYTGAISAGMLQEAGCSYVLVGHSERRLHFGETLESSHRRVTAALRAGLRPILCVGETLEERESNRTTAVVGEQLEAALGTLTPKALLHLVVAYEPVWAIGTGKVATAPQAQEVHAFIRESLRTRDPAWADGLRILYGGSVKPDSAEGLMAESDIDGLLVGGASLEADAFVAIAKAGAPPGY